MPWELPCGIFLPYYRLFIHALFFLGLIVARSKMKCHQYPFVLLLLACLGAISCESGKKPKKLELDPEAHIKAEGERTFERGTILDPLAIHGRAPESYALYLPKGYLTGYTWPTVLFFDPKGKGSKPLERYKDLADQFGFILIGSNFSRNGKPMEEALEHINALKHDLPAGIKIDPFRIFLIGFSGGARVAVADAIANADVAGVVGCGAGFPQLKENVELSFNYMAMVGRQDFNYAEFAVLDKELSARGSNHILIEFEGKHAWPKDKQMLEAFKWMTVYSYSQGEVIDMGLMDSLYKSDVKHLLKIENSEDLRSIVQFYKKMIFLYKGLAKVEEQEKRLEMLKISSAYKAYESELKTVLAEEMKSRSEYTRQMAQKDHQWWEKEVAKIRKEIENQSNLLVKYSRQRLLAYLSISSFMQIEAALNRGFLPQAKKLLYILNLVDPQNPDYYYLSAKLMLKQGKKEQAVELLKEAARYGFDDWETLNDERIFDPVRSYLNTIQ